MINNIRVNKEPKKEATKDIIVVCAINAVVDLQVFAALGAAQAGLVSAVFKLVVCSVNKIAQSRMTPEMKDSFGVGMDIIETGLKYAGRTWWGGAKSLEITTKFLTGLSNGFLYKMTDWGTPIEITDSWPKLLTLLFADGEVATQKAMEQLIESVAGNVQAALALEVSVREFIKPTVAAYGEYLNGEIFGSECVAEAAVAGLTSTLASVI